MLHLVHPFMHRAFTLACLLVSLSASFAAAQTLRSVRIDSVPHVRQKPDFCGEACAEMTLRKLGSSLNQDDVFNKSGVDPLQGRGCYTRDLAVALRRIGFDVGHVWHEVAVADSKSQLESAWALVHADLMRGTPSILCMRYSEREGASEHFRLIVGYNATTDEVIYHEPAIDDGAYQTMPRATLLSIWPLKYRADRWTLIRMPLRAADLKTREVAVAVPVAGFTDADYAQHIRALREKLPSDDYHIVLQKPFVVVGNESKEMVARRASGTVKWAVERIKKDYFTKDPHHIIDVWLFKDKDSYNTTAEKLWGSKPGTPYGYYSRRHRALVMNISTGGGTLVHEIVHPFMESNFPACPSWFNEGLASLYEQSSERDGHIVGLTNWRLRGLQAAIAEDRVPTFKTLCSTTTHEFYDDDPGTNYAQARYLCYYLQESGVLVKYYHEFNKNAAKDPTGYETLKQVLGREDMAKFKKDWEAYSAKLRFP